MGNWTAVGGPLPWAHGTGCTLPQRGCQRYARQEQQQQAMVPGAHSNSSTSASGRQPQLFCDARASLALGGKLRYSPSASYRSVGQCGSPR